MPSWRLLLLVLLVAPLASGCVSMKKYRELENNLAATQQSLAERVRHVESLEEEIRTLEKDLEEIKAALEEAKAKNTRLLQDKGQLSKDVESMKQALAELEARKAEAERRIAAFRDLLARFQRLIDAGKLRVKIVDGRMVVELATDVLFASGSADLSADGKTAIVEVAGILAGIPDRSFQVEGHTDNVPIRTAQYPSNWDLAAARALTVVKTMCDAGMPPTRISAASFAENRPVGPNDSPEGKAGNRRIEIVVVPDLSSLPGFAELQKAAGEPQRGGPLPPPGGGGGGAP